MKPVYFVNPELEMSRATICDCQHSSTLRVIYSTDINLLFKLPQSFAGHSHNLDASVMTFQPIQGIQAFKLPPVEETRSLAY
jgi:hypothetical protein